MQNSMACKDFVALFSPAGFSVVDPAGSPPIITTTDLMANCVGGGDVFSVIRTQIVQSWSPGFVT
jgi:hypothetical protein